MIAEMKLKRTSTHDAILAVVRRIPRGKVATYGQIAALAGLPRQARLVGYALHSLKSDGDAPWHRVVNARGEISKRSADHPAVGIENLQRALLEAEGVRFDMSGRIALDEWLWKPKRSNAVAN